jgi:hypothetical protein
VGERNGAALTGQAGAAAITCPLVISPAWFAIRVVFSTPWLGKKQPGLSQTEFPTREISRRHAGLGKSIALNTAPPAKGPQRAGVMPTEAAQNRFKQRARKILRHKQPGHKNSFFSSCFSWHKKPADRKAKKKAGIFYSET